MQRWWPVVVGLVVLAGVAWAGRPLTVDDADPVAPGMVEAEGGVAFEDAGADRAIGVAAGLACGVAPGLEVGVASGALRARTDGATETGADDTVVAAKWRYAGADSVFRQAVVPAVKLATADDGKGLGSGETDADLTWIGSLAVGDAMGIHANVGYTWVGSPDGEAAGDVVHGGLATDGMLCECLQGVCELWAEDERGSDAETMVAYSIGLRWWPSEDLVLDVAGGAPLSGDGPDFTVTAGLTYAFEGFSF